MRAEVRQILQGVDAQFEPIARGDLSSLDPVAREAIDAAHGCLRVPAAEDIDANDNNGTDGTSSYKQAYVVDAMDDDKMGEAV